VQLVFQVLRAYPELQVPLVLMACQVPPDKLVQGETRVPLVSLDLMVSQVHQALMVYQVDLDPGVLLELLDLQVHSVLLVQLEQSGLQAKLVPQANLVLMALLVLLDRLEIRDPTETMEIQASPAKLDPLELLDLRERLVPLELQEGDLLELQAWQAHLELMVYKDLPVPLVSLAPPGKLDLLEFQALLVSLVFKDHLGLVSLGRRAQLVSQDRRDQRERRVQLVTLDRRDPQARMVVPLVTMSTSV